MRKVILFGCITLFVSTIVFPIVFNFLFMWESGLAKGKPGDWFVLHGNIIGGLIGGFFTYLAVTLTLNQEKKNKEDEERPLIDISSQNILIEELEGEMANRDIIIELHNIGGSLAKNLEYTLILQNHEKIISEIKRRENHLKKEQKVEIQFSEVKMLVENNRFENKDQEFYLSYNVNKGPFKSIGALRPVYPKNFLGTSVSIRLNHEASSKIVLNKNLSNWIRFYIQYIDSKFDDIFDFTLEVNYTSAKYEPVTEKFKISWEHIETTIHRNSLTYSYVLKSEKLHLE